MKRLPLILPLLAVLFSIPAFAGYFYTFTVVNAQTVAASGTYTSAAVDMAGYYPTMPNITPEGFFSLQAAITGSGTVKIEALVSNDGVNFQEAEGATDIMTGKTAGTYIASFTLPVCRSVKIKVTETGAANNATVTAILGMQ